MGVDHVDRVVGQVEPIRVIDPELEPGVVRPG